ncbi:MAG TPA: class I SAM-dependent methyltransferase [Frankiaceae bacterium]|nr:class I SAM-dependent methyltransferase [Frankiaceae bacterium]
MTRWPQGGGAEYAARFAALAATGQDLHGEARFCSALVPPGSRVLDAGCGTGRVAIELARHGYACVGTDVDPTMLAEAERAAPDLRWIRADLASLHLDDEPPFDLVVCAGNVVPLVAPATEAAAVRAMAAQLRPGGFLVTGFGLDRAHLPRSAALIDLGEFDGWCSAAGLEPVVRSSTWDGDPWPGDGGYAVSVFRRS